jgi:PEP-CTERM motif
MQARRWTIPVSVAVLSAVAASARADIFFDPLTSSTGPPPATVGGIAVTPFLPDPRPIFASVRDVPTPFGGTLDLGRLHSHRRVGAGWGSWSHGYTGDVYSTDGATTDTLILPAGTTAFYFYVEPGPFAERPYTVTATSSTGDTATTTLLVEGFAGAEFIGVYATSGQTIGSIALSSTDTFAIGEFGISGVVGAPEPSSLALMAFGALGLALRQRFP